MAKPAFQRRPHKVFALRYVGIGPTNLTSGVPSRIPFLHPNLTTFFSGSFPEIKRVNDPINEAMYGVFQWDPCLWPSRTTRIVNIFLRIQVRPGESTRSILGRTLFGVYQFKTAWHNKSRLTSCNQFELNPADFGKLQLFYELRSSIWFTRSLMHLEQLSAGLRTPFTPSLAGTLKLYTAGVGCGTHLEP